MLSRCAVCAPSTARGRTSCRRVTCRPPGPRTRQSRRSWASCTNWCAFVLWVGRINSFEFERVYSLVQWVAPPSSSIEHSLCVRTCLHFCFSRGILGAIQAGPHQEPSSVELALLIVCMLAAGLPGRARVAAEERQGAVRRVGRGHHRHRGQRRWGSAARLAAAPQQHAGQHPGAGADAMESVGAYVANTTRVCVGQSVIAGRLGSPRAGRIASCLRSLSMTFRCLACLS